MMGSGRSLRTSRVAIALARTRLMAARFPYYILADSNDGLIKEAEINKLAGEAWEDWEIPREARSDDLKSSLQQWWHLRLEPLRAEINKLAGEA